MISPVLSVASADHAGDQLAATRATVATKTAVRGNLNEVERDIGPRVVAISLSKITDKGANPQRIRRFGTPDCGRFPCLPCRVCARSRTRLSPVPRVERTYRKQTCCGKFEAAHPHRR